MIIACIIISFIVGAFAMFCAIGLMSCRKDKKPRNKVRFFVTRNKNGELNLSLNKPLRNNSLRLWYHYSFYDGKSNKYHWVSTRIVEGEFFNDLGLNPDDFKNLKWEDEPIEVFLNLED